MKNIVITGPTCTGKTEAAVALAEKINGEIISADSRQVYRRMDVGTAKPSKGQRERARHHLIDILEPDQRYTAADFRRDAEEKINEINSRGRTPLIAGGTGLYIKALVNGIFTGPAADGALRKELEEKTSSSGLESLYAELGAVDPDCAANIHPNDKRRIIRALEIYRLTGKPASSLKKWEAPAGRFEMFAFDMPRRKLYAAIDERVLRMFTEGLLDEVKKLLEMGFGEDLVSMEAVGYREVIECLKGNIPLRDAMEKTMASTRAYARRQLTWFRGDKRIHWLKIDRNSDPALITDRIMGLMN